MTNTEDPDKFAREGRTFSGQFPKIPLAIEQWLARDLPEPDYLMGSWLTTTSRVEIVGPTGLGKTNFAMALAIHAAAGVDFLHWDARRPARVLFIDGEMSRRLLPMLRCGFEHIISHQISSLFGSFQTQNVEVPHVSQFRFQRSVVRWFAPPASAVSAAL